MVYAQIAQLAARLTAVCCTATRLAAVCCTATRPTAVSLAQEACHAALRQALCKKRAKAFSVLRRGFEGRGRGALRRDAGRVSGWPQCELSATRLHKQDFTVHKQDFTVHKQDFTVHKQDFTVHKQSHLHKL